jgi:hypothetical protein
MVNHPAWKGCDEEEWDQAREALERLVMTKLYK